MKKIIDNKLYDTDKYELIIRYKKKIKHPGLFCDSYPYHYISIYKTKKGTYIKHIGKSVTAGWNSKEDLKILEINQVKEILTKINAVKEYCEQFEYTEEE